MICSVNSEGVDLKTKTVTTKTRLEPETAFRAEDEFHEGMALLLQSLDAILSEETGFPEKIARRGRVYDRAEITIRRDRIMEDLAYIREYIRQCSKSIDWPEGRRLV
jgi:hypothetical protein